MNQRKKEDLDDDYDDVEEMGGLEAPRVVIENITDGEDKTGTESEKLNVSKKNEKKSSNETPKKLEHHPPVEEKQQQQQQQQQQPQQGPASRRHRLPMANYLLPPGALPIRGMGRRGMGSEYSEATILYSANESQGNNDVITPQDTTEDVVIQDAFLAEQGRKNRRRQRNKPTPDLVVGNVERSRRSYATWIAGFFVVLLSAALVTLLVLLTNKTDEKPVTDEKQVAAASTSEAPTVTPTDIPSVFPPSATPSISPTASVAPTSERLALLIDEVRRQFQSPTLDLDLQSASSPQYKAALWMAEEDVSAMTLRLSFPLSEEESILQFRNRYALAVFYYATNGENWFVHSNFLNETLHVCDWNVPWHVAIEANPDLEKLVAVDFIVQDFMGIECDSELNVVRGMELVLNNLSGTLPEEVQGLDNMAYMFLDNNNLQGTIPWMAFNNTFLQREYGVVLLEVISLIRNQLTGSIPEEIGALTNLLSIWLQSNQLTGQIPSFSMNGTSQLAFLGLQDNILSGSIPERLFAIESLEGLDLRKNMLNGTLPDNIVLPSLTSLELYQNDFSGTIPDAIGSCTSLTWLELSENSLSGTILPESMRLLTLLDSLYLQGNQLTGIGLNWSVISGMSDLRRLWISENHVTGTIPTEIGSLIVLETLEAGRLPWYNSSTSMTGTLPTELGNLHRMERLVVRNNEFSGTVPTELGNLLSLEMLALNDNWGITGTIPTELNNLSSLGTLHVHNTGIVGDFSGLCEILEETDSRRQFGFWADCLEDDVLCDCCNGCCDNKGYCENNDFIP